MAVVIPPPRFFFFLSFSPYFFFFFFFFILFSPHTLVVPRLLDSSSNKMRNKGWCMVVGTHTPNLNWVSMKERIQSLSHRDSILLRTPYDLERYLKSIFFSFLPFSMSSLTYLCSSWFYKWSNRGWNLGILLADTYRADWLFYWLIFVCVCVCVWTLILGINSINW